MKTITLTVLDDLPGVKDEMACIGFMEASIKNPPQQGFDLVEMRKRLKILDALAEARKNPGPALVLDDDFYSVLKDSMLAMRWYGMSAKLVSFISQFEQP